MSTPDDFGTDRELVGMGEGDEAMVRMASVEEQRELAIGPAEPICVVRRLDGTVERYAVSRTRFCAQANWGCE